VRYDVGTVSDSDVPFGIEKFGEPPIACPWLAERHGLIRLQQSQYLGDRSAQTMADDHIGVVCLHLRAD